MERSLTDKRTGSAPVIALDDLQPVGDLPAVWSCPCGAWRLCYRAACQLRIPRDHRDGACGKSAPLLRWLPAHAEDMDRLSARRRLIWVALDRKGKPLARDGYFAELPSSVSVNDALADYRTGLGAGSAGAVVRWQMWDHGRMGPRGDGMAPA